MPPPGRPAGARRLLLLLLPPLLCAHRGRAEDLTVAVVLPLTNTSYPWSWVRVGPALELALAGLRARPGSLASWTVRTVLGSSEDARGVCSDTAAPLAAVDLKWEHRPAVFLGPGCVYAAAPVGRFTAHWRLPLLTAGAPALGFGSKDEYALMTRTGPSHAKLGDLVVELHRQLGWRRQALVLYAYRPGDDQPCYFVVEGLYLRVRQTLNVTVDHLEFAEDDRDHYVRLLRTVQRKGRGERPRPRPRFLESSRPPGFARPASPGTAKPQHWLPCALPRSHPRPPEGIPCLRSPSPQLDTGCGTVGLWLSSRPFLWPVFLPWHKRTPYRLPPPTAPSPSRPLRAAHTLPHWLLPSQASGVALTREPLPPPPPSLALSSSPLSPLPPPLLPQWSTSAVSQIPSARSCSWHGSRA